MKNPGQLWTANWSELTDSASFMSTVGCYRFSAAIARKWDTSSESIPFLVGGVNSIAIHLRMQKKTIGCKVQIGHMWIASKDPGRPIHPTRLEIKALNAQIVFGTDEVFIDNPKYGVLSADFHKVF